MTHAGLKAVTACRSDGRRRHRACAKGRSSRRAGGQATASLQRERPVRGELHDEPVGQGPDGHRPLPHPPRLPARLDGDHATALDRRVRHWSPSSDPDVTAERASGSGLSQLPQRTPFRPRGGHSRARRASRPFNIDADEGAGVRRWRPASKICGRSCEGCEGLLELAEARVHFVGHFVGILVLLA